MTQSVANHINEMLFLFLCCTFAAVVTSDVVTTQPEVTLTQGTVRGLYKLTLANRQYSSFEGIPYARPPEGKYRFKAPEPAKPWLGIYNATRKSPICLQLNLMKLFGNVEFTGSEDCLYINVYSPKLPTGEPGEKPLDVIAFIHGGGYHLGASSFHDASFLLDRDVVFVTFNYRLGPLGFLSTGDCYVPGNNGLKDQVLALKWIKDNIAAFGGNPDSVTISGVSAGGASCHLHLLSPLSKGLFKGAICMSGTSLNPWSLSRNSKQKAIILAEYLGCPTNNTKTMIKCLRMRPAEHIIASQSIFWHWKLPGMPFGPVVEPANPEAFLVSEPADLIKRKEAADVPLLLTFTADEGLCFTAGIITNQDLLNEMVNDWDNIVNPSKEMFPSMTSEQCLIVTQKIKEYYKIDNTTEGAKNLVKGFGDFYFNSGIAITARLHSSLYSSPVYLSKFSYRGENSLTNLVTKENLGVAHGDDALYITGVPIVKLTTESDLQMSKKMVDLWVSFAANGKIDGWSTVNDHLPKIALSNILGPDETKPLVVDEIGEEQFWDSLFKTQSTHDEL